MVKILEIINLRKYYHDCNGETLAIDNISLSINENDFISIVGTSGCGKSTLLSILAGLENTSYGKIKYYKNNLVIGYMLQNDSLFPWKNVLDNCLVGLEIKGKVTKKEKDYVISLLKKYDLNDFIYKYPSELSGGMRQRVALIRTLAINPDILLLDEPLSALDYQTRLSLSDDLYRIIKSEKKTAIMVTHDLGEPKYKKSYSTTIHAFGNLLKVGLTPFHGELINSPFSYIAVDVPPSKLAAFIAPYCSSILASSA